MKIAVAQFSPVLANKVNNIGKVISALKEAKNRDADLVVFPELALTGYSIGEILPSIAESKNGQSLKEIGEACKALKIYALVSFPEKDNGNYYISSALLKDDGTIAGIYRKTHLFHTEAKYFKRGNSWPVFDTKFGKIGAMICYDLEFPEVSRLLRLKGAQVILVNTNNMEPYQKHQNVYMQSRALENEIPIVICNRNGKENELIFFGQSMAVDHEGNVLFKLESEEAIQIVDVDLHGYRDPKLAYTNNLHNEIKNKLNYLIT